MHAKQAGIHGACMVRRAALRMAPSCSRPCIARRVHSHTITAGAPADKLEQTKLAERAQKEAAKAERDKAKVDKEQVGCA